MLAAVGPVVRGRLPYLLLAGTFLACCFVYVRVCLDPRLLYHGHEVALPSGQSVFFPVYLQGAEFLREFLHRPGGLSEYLGARFAQYYFYPNLGALVLTVVVGLVFLAAEGLVRLSDGAAGRYLPFLAALLVVTAYGRYTFPLESYVATIVALGAAVSYLAGSRRMPRLPVRLALFGGLSAAVYYATGALYIVFALVCAMAELTVGRRYVLGGLYVLAAAGAPLLGVWLAGVTFADAYSRPAGIRAVAGFVPAADPGRPTPADSSAAAVPPAEAAYESAWSAALPAADRTLVTALLALYVLCVLLPLGPSFQRLLGRWRSAACAGGGRLVAWCLGERRTPVYAVAALLILCALVARYALDEEARAVLRANYLARVERWPEFLEEIDRHPPRECSASLMGDINRALFETGQMGSRMFSYPQSPHGLFRFGKEAAALRGGCEVLFRLGRVNEAEHAALEALEMNGPRPEILRLLAEIYTVKREPDTARVFLGVLSRDLVHGSWAVGRLRRLRDEPPAPPERESRDLRSCMPQADMVSESSELVLLALLATNRNNRMAFEYLMAYYLLTRQPDKVVCHLGRLNDFGSDAFASRVIPEHYAEAMLLYFQNVGRPQEAPPQLPGWTIPEAALRRAREVIRIAGEHPGDEKARDDVILARFPCSACCYLLTGKSGGSP